MKQCKRCNEEKPRDLFHNQKDQVDGKNPLCKDCVKARSRDRIARQLQTLEPRRVCRTCDEEKETTVDFPRNVHAPAGYLTQCKSCLSDASALARWGIPNMLQKVDEGYCEICKDKLQRNNYAVDHDHSCCEYRLPPRSCGKCVRGLICQSCNHGLGNFKEDPDRMLAAIDYLRRYAGVG